MAAPFSSRLISQPSLDLTVKERSNVFPWRGQFSPEFVEVILKTYASRGDTVFDPFAGVGTTLLESAKLGLRSRGTELNPSAYLMAQSVEWVRYSRRDRKALIAVAEKLLLSAIGFSGCSAACSSLEENQQARAIALALQNDETSSETKHLLSNSLMRGMWNGNHFLKAFQQHCQILLNLPEIDESHYVFHADARSTPLAPSTIDLVVTSPPYINVFNYHENNRAAMELMGWDILSVARAELGSNRKNRGNRFLTVIQYCLDMRATLLELKRVLKEGGRAIFVVGRESNVRGVPFENGQLVSSLAASSGFRVSVRQERKFQNRFGQYIYEDILYLEQVKEETGPSAREIAHDMLLAKMKIKSPDAVQSDLRNAIQLIDVVGPSPVYSLL